jgi:hypothetical protein
VLRASFPHAAIAASDFQLVEPTAGFLSAVWHVGRRKQTRTDASVRVAKTPPSRAPRDQARFDADRAKSSSSPRRFSCSAVEPSNRSRKTRKQQIAGQNLQLRSG